VQSALESRSAVRAAAALLVVATGAIHLYLYQDYFSSVATIGRLFMANFATGLIIGILILRGRRRLWAAAGAAFCLLTLGAFLVSVHWGLFGYNESLAGPWQERAAAVEVAGASACALAATRR
jgi:urea transporter